MSIEKMDEFFTTRVEGYENQMLYNVEGCAEGYKKMAKLVNELSTNEQALKLLDLGCGTGLELDEIFKLLPETSVTGIDLTQAMLDKLHEKHGDKNLNLICGSYFDVDFGENCFDVAVSFQTMHHFSHEKKIELYKKINRALTVGGVYIECDYMVEAQAEEDLYFAENARLRAEIGVGEDEFYHYDTPCTIENQIKMFKKAGFSDVQQVYRMENTTIIVGKNLNAERGS